MKMSSTLTPAASLGMIFYQMMLGVRTNMPAIVDSEKPYKLGELWCIDVIPAINFIDKTGETPISKPMAKLAGVPVVTLCGGAFHVTVPIKRGDSVWLSVGDRGIDNWQETGARSDPPELDSIRHHDLSDCVAIVGALTASQGSEYFNDGVEISTADGSTFTRLGKDYVEIVESGGGSMKLSGNTLTIDANIVHKGDTDHSGNTTQTGNLQQIGNTTSSGTVTGSSGLATAAGTAITSAGAAKVASLDAAASLTVAGISVLGHTHPTPAGQSGAMQ